MRRGICSSALPACLWRWRRRHGSARRQRRFRRCIRAASCSAACRTCLHTHTYLLLYAARGMVLALFGIDMAFVRHAVHMKMLKNETILMCMNDSFILLKLVVGIKASFIFIFLLNFMLCVFAFLHFTFLVGLHCGMGRFWRLVCDDILSASSSALSLSSLSPLTCFPPPFLSSLLLFLLYSLYCWHEKSFMQHGSQLVTWHVAPVCVASLSWQTGDLHPPPSFCPSLFMHQSTSMHALPACW